MIDPKLERNKKKKSMMKTTNDGNNNMTTITSPHNHSHPKGRPRGGGGGGNSSRRRKRGIWILILMLSILWMIIFLLEMTDNINNNNNSNNEDSSVLPHRVITHYHHDQQQEGKRATTTATTSSSLQQLSQQQQQQQHFNYLYDSLYTCQPTHTACNGYDGILHIKMGDYGGAGGTIFFQFVIGQLIYANKYNLLPFVHFTSYSRLVYDPDIHDDGKQLKLDVNTTKMKITNRRDPRWPQRAIYPGPPIIVQSTNSTTTTSLSEADGGIVVLLNGTGIWDHYFARVSNYCPTDISCQNKPYVTMSHEQISPGLHRYAPWSPKVWRYKQLLPDYLGKPHLSLWEWLLPQRLMASNIVQKYYKFQPTTLLSQINNQIKNNQYCLGLHIRWSDKGVLTGSRRFVRVSEFLPYVQIYLQQFVITATKTSSIKPCVYVATDSIPVINEIYNTWPNDIQQYIIYSQASIRSPNTTAVFNIVNTHHHITNIEVLRDIIELSYCSFLIHGKSAVSESAIYLNSNLIYQSINLETDENDNNDNDLDDIDDDDDDGSDPNTSSIKKFGIMVSDVLSGRITSDYWQNVYKPPREWWEEVVDYDNNNNNPPTSCRSNTSTNLQLVPPRSEPYSMSIRKLVNRMFVVFWKELATTDDYVVVDPIWHTLFYSKQQHHQQANNNNNCRFFSKSMAPPLIQQAIVRLGDALKDNNKNKKLSFSGFEFDIIRSDAAMVTNHFMEIRDHIKTYSDTKIFNNNNNKDNTTIASSSSSTTTTTTTTTNCLGIFVSDPGYKRDPTIKDWVQVKYPESTYDSYIESYIQSFSGVVGSSSCIYLATDSYSLWKRYVNFTESTISKLTSARRRQSVIKVYTIKNAVRNRKHVPANYMEERIGRLGNEVLLDIWNLVTRCKYIVHGGHRIADVALMLNPNITSININDPNRMNITKFTTEIMTMIKSNT